jgi:hypothetical protein
VAPIIGRLSSEPVTVPVIVFAVLLQAAKNHRTEKIKIEVFS